MPALYSGSMSVAAGGLSSGRALWQHDINFCSLPLPVCGTSPADNRVNLAQGAIGSGL